MSLKKNLLKNGIATSLQKLIRVFNQLLLVPFFISAWGPEYYGEWLTLTIIPSVLAFADLGFGTAAANSFVLAYVSGDKKKAADISFTGQSIITVIVLAGVLVSGIVLITINYFGLFKYSIIPGGEVIWAMSFMMAARLMSFYNQLFEAYFRAARKAAKGIHLANFQNILALILGFVVLFMKLGVVPFAFSQFFVAVSFRFYYRWVARRTLGLEKEFIGKFVKQYGKDIFSKGMGYLMSPMWQVLLFQGTTLIVRITLGATAVTIFNTVRTLSRSVNQIYSIINGTFFPELQFEIGSGNIKRAQRIFVKSIQISFFLAFVGIFVLLLAGLPIYNAWTGNMIEIPVKMWYIFLAGIMFNSIWWTAATVFRAMNEPYKLTFIGLIASILAIVVTFFCCKYWELNGAAFGSLLFELIMVFSILPLSCKMMGVKLKDIFIV